MLAHSQTVVQPSSGRAEENQGDAFTADDKHWAGASVTLPHWISTEKIIWFHIKIIRDLSFVCAPQWRWRERLNGSFDQPSASVPPSE